MIYILVHINWIYSSVTRLGEFSPLWENVYFGSLKKTTEVTQILEDFFNSFALILSKKVGLHSLGHFHDLTWSP
jgi:hypothetical protein